MDCCAKRAGGTNRMDSKHCFYIYVTRVLYGPFFPLAHSSCLYKPPITHPKSTQSHVVFRYQHTLLIITNLGRSAYSRQKSLLRIYHQFLQPISNQSQKGSSVEVSDPNNRKVSPSFTYLLYSTLLTHSFIRPPPDPTPSKRPVVP